MENMLAADAFIVKEQSSTTRPLFIVKKKVVINLLKTALFLMGIIAMIINQSRKDKLAQGVSPVEPLNITISSDQASLPPFNFLK